MNQTGLNLARAWRSQSFDEIIGQELVVRLLKNSLFKNCFFPVYLLAGQRGSGKTTTARVFAAALNCEHLPIFQQNPQHSILPCRQCSSCMMVREQRHPDFIEIDAASHTGVDNIRLLIEGASFLPVMGRKKIYLVDEAHMLSKAAFNAFLKILEEPPADVLFLLATTDPHKIIDTVASRCFKLFFDPIKPSILINHLKKICDHEQIKYEEKALALIVQESEGSARDALNTLERLRLATDHITEQAVILVLQVCEESHIVYLFECLVQKKYTEFLHYAQQHAFFESNGVAVWKKIMSFLQALLYTKHGIPLESFSYYASRVEQVVAFLSLDQISGYMELCYGWEPNIHKTVMPGTLLSLLVFKLFNAQGNNNSVPGQKKIVDEEKKSRMSEKNDNKKEQEPVPHTPTVADALSVQPASEWSVFLEAVKQLEDPLLLSIFSQAVFKGIENQKVVLHFSTEFTFFKELLEDTKKTWLGLIHRHFGDGLEIEIQFTAASERQIKVNKNNEKKSPSQTALEVVRNGNTKPSFNEKASQGIASKPYSYQSKFHQKSASPSAAPALTNLDNYPTAQMLLRLFPGTITEIKD